MKTLTIVARNPDPNNNRPMDSDGNVAIEEIVRKIPGCRRAASVTEVVSVLRGQTPDVVQIVGHGSPGELSLGMFWNRLYKSETPTRLTHFVLDSNPSSYGILGHQLPQSTTTLRLLGCRVGEESLWGGADGPALQFDLQHALKLRGLEVAIELAFGDIGPENFSADDGTFLAEPLGRDVEPPPVEPQIETEIAVTWDNVGSVPLLGALSRTFERPRGLDVEQRAVLKASFHTTVGVGPLLFFPEVEFGVTVRGEKLVAQLVGNGRFMRIVPSGENQPSVYLKASGGNQDPDLVRTIRTVVQAASAEVSGLDDKGLVPPP